jgi:hypothetical protein
MAAGSAIALEYKIEERGWTSLFQGFVFQYRQPVVLARFSVRVPMGWRVRAIGHQMPVAENSTGGRTRDRWHHWTAHDLPYIPDLDLEPPSGSIATTVMVSISGPGAGSAASSGSQPGFDNWEAVSSWYAGLTAPSAVPDEEVHRATRRVTEGLEGTADEIKAIAAFVQGIRYVAVEIGEGKWAACPATETLRNRYGDCKDKTSLMRAMLAARGIPSVSVLANPGSGISEDLANPLQFSHVIVGIPTDSLPFDPGFPDATADGWLFYDPSVGDIPLGTLPWSMYGHQVLPCAEEGGRLVRLRLPEARELNHRSYHITGAIDEDGNLSADVEVIDRGYAALEVNRRRMRTSLAEQTSEWREIVLASAPAPLLSGYQHAPHPDSAWMRFQVEAPAYAAGSDSIMLLKLDFLHPALPPAIIDEGRTLPVYFGRRRLEDLKAEWQIPDGWIIDAAASSDSPMGDPPSRGLPSGDPPSADSRSEDSLWADSLSTIAADLRYSVHVIDDRTVRLNWSARYTGEMADSRHFPEMRELSDALSALNSLTLVLRRKEDSLR